MTLLQREGVRGVEMAPTRWRDDPLGAPRAEVLALRHRWDDAGISIVSLQSLLFGRPDLQLFGDAATRDALRAFLVRTMDFAAALGARALVFGSPKNRIRGSIPPAEAMRSAADFFRALAPAAAERGCVICLEANPAVYGGDFVLTTRDARELARMVGHPAIAVNIDLGGIALGDENAREEILSARDVIGHVHASEPQLAEVKASAKHREAGEALASIRYPHWVSIEMRAQPEGDNVAAVERAIHAVKKAYR